MITNEDWQKLKVGDVVYRADKQLKQVIKLTINKFWDGFLTAFDESNVMYSIGKETSNTFRTERETVNFFDKLERI